jgi:hypothetical protein
MMRKSLKQKKLINNLKKMEETILHQNLKYIKFGKKFVKKVCIQNSKKKKPTGSRHRLHYRPTTVAVPLLPRSLPAGFGRKGEREERKGKGTMGKGK